MGVNNKQRRAAKQKKRARQSPRPGRPDASEGLGWDAISAYGLVEMKVSAAVRRLGRRKLDAAGLAGSAERLAASTAPHPRHVLEAVVTDVLVGIVHGVAEGGWPPADQSELVRRNLGESHLPTLVAALHKEFREHSKRGREWLAAVDAVGTAHTLQLQSTPALASALGVAALLAHAPQLTDAVAVSLGDAQSEHPKLAQVRALLAKAESTDFDEEAEALSAKAQELITRYALGRLMADGPVAADGNAPRVRRLWLDAPYARAKAALVASVASANRCEAASADRLGFTVVVGAADDLDAVELLVTSLLVQADVAMLRHGRRYDETGVPRTRSFRQSFLTAYATRVGERLHTATAAAARAGGADLLPVLRTQEARVAEEFERLVPHTVGKSASVSNGEGWMAGLVAADLALLDVNGKLDEAAG